METVIFLDLDDSVFQTLPKCPPGEAVSPVAYRRDGEPLSFMTARQRTFIEMLFRAGTVIPATARGLDAFRRVDLPFPGPAIVGFGGVVLRADGTPDPGWEAHIRPLCEGVAEELDGHLRATVRFIAERRLGAHARVISDLGMQLYIVVKHPDGDASKLDPIREGPWAAIAPERYFVHHNGNNLSLVPRFLGKERAVRHVLAGRPGPVLALGVGDSFSDAPFLSLCDFALVPRGSQLGRLLGSGGC